MIKQVNLIFVWCLFMSFLHPCSILPETPHGFVLFSCFKCQNVRLSNSQTGVYTNTTETNYKLCQGQNSFSKIPFENILIAVLATWRQCINVFSVYNTTIFDKNVFCQCTQFPVHTLRHCDHLPHLSHPLKSLFAAKSTAVFISYLLTQQFQ